MITIEGSVVLPKDKIIPGLEISGSDSLKITIHQGNQSNPPLKVETCTLNIDDNSTFKFELNANPNTDTIIDISSSGLWLANNEKTVFTKWKLSGTENIKRVKAAQSISGVVLDYVLADIKNMDCPSDRIISNVATNTGSINTSISELTSTLSAYPLMISDSDVGRGRTVNARTGHSDSDLNRIAENAMRKILGRVPAPGDYKSFRNSLDQSFEIRQVEGHTEYTWNPRGYAGQADLGGGVTGKQASVYKIAKVALDNVIPLLDGLYSLKTKTDLEAAAGIRNIIKSSLQDVVRELGLEGGPRVAKVDDLINRVDKMLNKFAGMYGFNDKSLIDSLEKDLNYSSYTTVKDFIGSIKSNWNNSKTNLSHDLGAKLIALSRSLSVTGESVGELIWAYNSVYIGESERKTSKLGTGNKEITVQDYLDWVLHFTEEEAPNLIHIGGKSGTGQLSDTIAALITYSQQLSENYKTYPRVKKAIESVQKNLEAVEKEAKNAYK